jgi:nitronate monooxygenase
MTLKELLGIELPIIQAPMAGVQGSALAVAVSNAGGLGSLPCAILGPNAIRKELAAITSQTRSPYNVNFFCHVPPKPDPEREANWRRLLSPYDREFGVDPDRHSLPAVPRGHHGTGSPRRAEKQGGAFYRDHESVQWRPCAGHHEPGHARTQADE